MCYLLLFGVFVLISLSVQTVLVNSLEYLSCIRTAVVFKVNFNSERFSSFIIVFSQLF